MGQAKKKAQNAKVIAFEKTRLCIFCGGIVPATTVDHCPPRAAFQNKGWPEGFVFPACVSCNGGSSRDDKIFAFLTNMNCEKGDLDHQRRLQQIILEIKRDYPSEVKEMINLGSAEKKEVAERIGLPKPPGLFYRSLPIVRLPNKFKSMALAVGRKITKAIHFSETGVICPRDADIESMFVSNVMNMENPISEELLRTMGRSHNFTRGGKDISRQFSYLCKISEDRTIALYIFRFNHSFQILSAYSASPNGLEYVRDQLESAQAGWVEEQISNES